MKASTLIHVFQDRAVSTSTVISIGSQTATVVSVCKPSCTSEPQPSPTSTSEPQPSPKSTPDQGRRTSNTATFVGAYLGVLTTAMIILTRV